MLFLNVIFIVAECSIDMIFYNLLHLFPVLDLFYSFKYYCFIFNLKIIIDKHLCCNFLFYELEF